MSTITTHRDLLAQEAMTLVVSVYRDTATFPREEVFGLASQLRRCAVSVPSNIAEGAARNSSREYVQYLGISCGSLSELETQLELAIRLGLMKPDAISFKHADRVARLVRALRKAVKTRVDGEK
jgi:four helix bundle protein